MQTKWVFYQCCTQKTCQLVWNCFEIWGQSTQNLDASLRQPLSNQSAGQKMNALDLFTLHVHMKVTTRAKLASIHHLSTTFDRNTKEWQCKSFSNSQELGCQPSLHGPLASKATSTIKNWAVSKSLNNLGGIHSSRMSVVANISLSSQGFKPH